MKSSSIDSQPSELTEKLIEKLRFVEIKQLIYTVVVQNYSSLIAVAVLGALAYFYLGMNLGDGASLIFTLSPGLSVGM